VGEVIRLHTLFDTLGSRHRPLIAVALFGILKLSRAVLLAFIPGILATALVVFFVKETAVSSGATSDIKSHSGRSTQIFAIFLGGSVSSFVGNSSDAFLFLACPKSRHPNAPGSGAVSYNERHLCGIFIFRLASSLTE